MEAKENSTYSFASRQNPLGNLKNPLLEIVLLTQCMRNKLSKLLQVFDRNWIDVHPSAFSSLTCCSGDITADY